MFYLKEMKYFWVNFLCYLMNYIDGACIDKFLYLNNSLHFVTYVYILF